MHVTTVIVGGGHAGLAMSRRLTDRSIDHVVIERGEVANSWRTERWDSLRLLTPNWQTRLPGVPYDGPDPDGFMTMPEVVSFIDRYARAVDAPVQTGTTVTRLSARGDGDDGYEVVTDRGVWTCRQRRARQRGGQRRCRPGACRGRAAVGADGDADDVPLAGRPRRAWRARRGGVGHRRAAGRRDPAHRAGGHHRGRRTRAAAADLSGPRRVLVDGGRRGLRRALRRDGRSRPRSSPSVTAAGRDSRSPLDRPERAGRPRCARRRAAVRHRRRRRPVLRRPAQRLRAGRPQDEPAARSFRRVGACGAAVRDRGAGAVRTGSCAVRSGARTRPPAGRHRHDRVGDGISPRPFVGRSAGVRSEAAGYVTTAAWCGTRRACTCSAPRCSAVAAPASSTAPRPTPPTSRRTCIATSSRSEC